MSIKKNISLYSARLYCETCLVVYAVKCTRAQISLRSTMLYTVAFNTNLARSVSDRRLCVGQFSLRLGQSHFAGDAYQWRVSRGRWDNPANKAGGVILQ